MEEKNGIDFVECPYCNKKTTQITVAHLKTHNKTFKEFKEEFPNMIFRCKKLSQLCLENQIRVQYNNDTNFCRSCGEKITWNTTFCSTQCAADFKKIPLVSENCLYCGDSFYTPINSDQKFCSRDCYDKFRGNKKLQNENNYFDKIKNKYGHQCVICNSFESLRIHHIDENHGNNKEENLILLCESCHRTVHSGIKILISKNLNISINPNGFKELCLYLNKDLIRMEISIRDNMNLNLGSVIKFDEISKILKLLIEERLRKENDSAELLIFYLFLKLRKYKINVISLKIFINDENDYIEYKKEN